VVLVGAPTAKTTDLLVTVNVVVGRQAAIAVGLRIVVLVGAPTAKTTDLLVTVNVVGLAPAEVGLLRPQGIGTVVEAVVVTG